MTTRFQLVPRVCLALVLLAAVTARVEGQLIHVPDDDSNGPTISLTGGVGLLIAGNRYDVVEGGRWSMGDGIQKRVMLDIATRSGSFGLVGTLATVSMLRQSSTSQGEIDLRQLMLSFRSPEGYGFHQTIEIAGGWSQWASYRGDDVLTAEEREPRNGFAVMIGYGAAFPIGDRVTFSFAQDVGAIIGSGKGLPVGESRSQSVYQTRMELRIKLSGG
jgi:hypothetical protein